MARIGRLWRNGFVMLRRIIKTLGICDREWGRLLSMSSLFFLLMVGWAFGRAGRDAFFIKEAGPDKLPYMYIINAILMVVTAALYAGVVDRIARYRFLILQLFGSGMLLLIFSVMIPLRRTWMPYAVFSLSEVVTLIFFMHFWTFANDIFDPREGKRIFPLVGGCGLIGTAIGGVLTKPIVGIIGTANLFVAWAVLLGAAIPITLWARRAAVSSGVMVAQHTADKDQGEAGGFLQTLSYVWQVPLLRTLTYLSIPMWLVVYIVDFQFFRAMDEVFAGQDQLSGFLGIFNSVTSLSGFALQLFVTSRLLRRFGVGSTALAHPMSMTLGSIALIVRSMLPASLTSRVFSFRALSGAFAKFSDNVVFYSIGESASQLLYNALPEEKRGQGRAFISGTIEPVCTALAGGVLLLFNAVSTPIYVISVMTVGLSIVWMALTLRVKPDYLRALVKNLSSRDLDLSSSALLELRHLKDAGTTSVLIEALSSPNDDVVLFALEMLQHIGGEDVMDELCDILPKTRPNTQIAILALLSQLEKHTITSAIYPLLDSPSPIVRATAVKAIGRLGDRDDVHRLQSFLDDTDLEVRAEAIIALMGGDAEADRNLRAVEIVQEMIHDSHATVRAKAAYILGEVRDKRWLPILIDLAVSNDALVPYEAITAMAKMADPQVVAVLIRLLGVERLASHASDAIVKLGDGALEPLHHALAGDDREPMDTNGISQVSIKANIISCLGQLRHPASIPVLVNQLEGQPEPIQEGAVDALTKIRGALTKAEKNREKEERTRYFPSEVVQTISHTLATLVQRMRKDQAYISALQQVHNEKATSLLIDALHRSDQQTEETALRCLELLSEPNTIRAAAANLRHAGIRAKAEAIEVLEGSGSEARGLVHVLEAKYLSSSEDQPQMPLIELSKTLLKEEQRTWPRACLIYAIGELDLTELASDLRELRREEHPLIRHHVHLSLQKMDADVDRAVHEKEVEHMAVSMQRMLFLRSVSLLADVDGSDLQAIAEIMQEKTCPAGEIVFKEHDPGDALYIIEQGSVRVVKGTEQQITLAILQAGDYFGEMALLDQEPRSASVEAQQESTLLMITREDFQRLLLARPLIAFALLKNLSRRLRETDTKLLESRAG